MTTAHEWRSLKERVFTALSTTIFSSICVIYAFLEHPSRV
jgi:hypothetical protein